MEPAPVAPPDTSDEALARDMIEVHGTDAAAVARATPAPRRSVVRARRRNPGSVSSD